MNNLLAPFTSNLRKYYIKESFVGFEKLQTIVYYHHRLFIIMMPEAILIPCLSKDEVFVRMKMLVCGGNRKGLEEIVVILERIIVVYVRNISEDYTSSSIYPHMCQAVWILCKYSYIHEQTVSDLLCS